MAIPFYEDEPVTAAAASLESSQITDGDQVDGPAYGNNAGYDQVDYEAPSEAATSNSQATSTNEETAPNTEEQLLAWKMLALAMCKVLKQFYLQQKQQEKGKSTKLTATVQIQPQAQ